MVLIVTLDARKHPTLALTLYLVQDVLTSGLVFGWPALAITLEHSGVYTELCKDGESECGAQSLRLTLVFAVGAFCGCFGNLGAGTILDRWGPRTSGILLVSVGMGGSLLFAFSDSRSFDAYIPAYAMIGFGYVGFHLTLLHIQAVFSKRRTVISLFVACFAASAFVFVVFQMATQHWGMKLRDLFLIHSGIVACLLVLGIFIWPSKPYTPYELLKDCEETTRVPSPSIPADTHYHILADNVEENEEECPVERQRSMSFCQFSPQSTQTAWQQLNTSEARYVTVWLCIHLLRICFVLGSINEQLRRMGDSKADTGQLYTHVFSLTVPASFIYTPAFGWLLDYKGLPFSIFLMNALHVISCVTVVIPSLPVQVVTALAFMAAWRGTLAVIYCFVPAVFGFRNFGKVTGAILAGAAVVSLLQYALVALSLALDSFLWVNLGLTVLSLPLFHFSWFLQKRVQI